MITSTIVFAHGSGNLIVAAALATGKCSFDFTKSVWAELQPNYNAARFAEFADTFCSYYPYFTAQQSQLQSSVNLCRGYSVAPGWKSLSPFYSPVGVSWSQVAGVIKSNVGAAMCGSYSAGLTGSSYFSIVQEYTYAAANDIVSAHSVQCPRT